MKNLVKLLLLLTLGAVICLPGMAMADFTLSSGAGTYWNIPQPGPQTPYYGDVPAGFTITAFDTYFVAPTTFTGNGTIGYGGSFITDGWGGTVVSGTESRATGPETTQLQWNYSFVGTVSYPMIFDINYFDGTTFVGHEHYSVGGNGGPYAGGFDMIQYIPAPLPPSVLLLGTGLLGLIGLRRKSRRGNRHDFR